MSDGSSGSGGLELEHLSGRYSICRLDPGAQLPGLIGQSRGRLVAATRTPEELSIVCPEELAPPGAKVSADWAALRVKGTISHDVTGVLAAIVAPLAAAELPIFAISSFDTDYVLVPAVHLSEVVGVLADAGHAVR